MSPHDTVRVSLAELPSILLPDNEVDENFCRHQTSIHYVFDLCSFNEEVNPLEVQDKKANNTPQCRQQFTLKRFTSFEDSIFHSHEKVLMDSLELYLQHNKINCKQEIAHLRKQFSSDIKNDTDFDQIKNLVDGNARFSEMERETLLATIALHMEEYFIVFPIVQALPEQMQYDILEMFTESIGICEKLICKFNKVKLSEQIVRQTKIIRTNLNKNQKVEMLKCDCSADGECNLLRLIEKWLLTVFFMKVVGVENQLNFKSFDECLRSETLTQITMNDLINQRILKSNNRVD